MFLKVSPMKGVMRFGKKGKLASRYIRLFEIRSKVDGVAYKLVVPPELSQIHPVFHVSMLRKYISDPSYVRQPQTVELCEDLMYEECPVAIVDRQVRQLRTKEIPMVKILWSNHTVEDYTWKTEAAMRDSYPYLFV